MARWRRKRVKDNSDQSDENAVPGPTGNAATNLLLLDIAMRAGFRFGRSYIERSLLKRKFTPDQAKRILEGRGVSRSVVSMVASRVATRSVPGAVLVGGGILTKALLSRRKSKRAQKAEGQEQLAEQAENS